MSYQANLWPQKFSLRYSLVEQLHKGNRFSLVKARGSDRTVVVKFPASDSPLQVFKLRKALSWEAKVLSTAAHPGLVRLIEFDSTCDYLVLEYLAGRSLLDSWSSKEMSQAFQCAAKIADALHALHSVGYLHLDLKPRNVVFRDRARSEPVIIDCGGARPSERPIVSDTIEPAMLGSGSFLFKAPEQLMHITDRFSPQTDAFALGVTSYWLLFGASPYSNSETTIGSARSRFQQEYARAIERCKSHGLPSRALKLFERILSVEMDERELSLDQVATQLRLCR